MKYLNNFLNRITIYKLLLYSLAAIVIVSICLSWANYLPYSPWVIFFQTAVLIVVCKLTNQAIGKLLKLTPNPESSNITALILALIFGPVNVTWANLLLLAGLALLATLSKYLLVIRTKHVFNPAAAGVVLSLFVFGQGASWWIGDRPLAWAVFLVGLLVWRKLRNFHLLLAFLAAYLGSLWLVFGIFDFRLIIYSPLLFFSAIMLVEPQTAPGTMKMRVLYGFAIGFLLTIYQKYFPVSYTLELSLLSGNLLTLLLPGQKHFKLTLNKSTKLAGNILGLFLTPSRKISFTPGQYLELTLPHKSVDRRGIRRFFSIASTPKDGQIFLATKIPQKPSSFKKALAKLAPGDTLQVSGPAGDFSTSPGERKLVFIAGGIGITPFLSILQSFDSKVEQDIVLIYSVGSANEVAFSERLQKYVKNKQVKLIMHFSDKQGYLSNDSIKQKIPDYKQRNFYVSGPEGMVQAINRSLSRLGIPPWRIRRDFFPGYN